MTQVCSLLSSTADVNDKDNNKRLPKGINIVGTDGKSGPRVEGMPASEKEDTPWGYLFIQHFAAESFDRKLEVLRQSEGFVPRCFIHRSVTYKRRPNGKGVMKEEKPSVSGLVFLQGETRDLQTFLQNYFPQYHLVNNCATGRPASIPHSIMTPLHDGDADVTGTHHLSARPFCKIQERPRQASCSHRSFQRTRRICGAHNARPPACDGPWRLCRCYQ